MPILDHFCLVHKLLFVTHLKLIWASVYIKYPRVTNLPFLSYIFSLTKCSNSPSEAVKRRKPSIYSSLGQLCALHKVVKARRLAGLWSCGRRTGLHCTDSVIAVCCTLLKAVCVPSGKPKLKHTSLLTYSMVTFDDFQNPTFEREKSG